jgi:7-carboxy-7-deazaguanine synthase
MEKVMCNWLLTENNELKCVIDMLKTCPYAGDNTNCEFIHSMPYDKNMLMNISEIYPAISGEGTSTGMVCVIVRLVGCVNRCRDCDSKYSYEGGTQRTTQDVVDQVLGYNIPTVLFTGGEPLLDPVVANNFLRAMMELGITVYVETSGAVDIRPAKMLAHVVMDVKCPSTEMHENMYYRNFSLIGYTDEIKFVVANREDYEYTKKVIEEQELVLKTPNIYISPSWSEDRTFFQELSNWMIEDKSVAKLMLQQHKCIWPAVKRGV